MPNMETYDFLVIGGGLFGVYSAIYLSRKNYRICLIEKEEDLLKKASIVNQARLHSGYHYPRSVATARIANDHKERFIREHEQFINFKFKKYYAIDRYGSFTNSRQFEKFCGFMNIKAEEIEKHELFDFGRIERLYLTEEYSFDPILIAEYYKQIIKDENIAIKMSCTVKKAYKKDGFWKVALSQKNDGNDNWIKAYAVINATYCGINTVNKQFNVKTIELMHQITEIALVSSEALQRTGLTIMDGHFCSIMPFGLSNLHTLSSVTYTHHKVSYKDEPSFDCQEINKDCRPDFASICNSCLAKPPSNKNKMMSQMRLYLNSEVKVNCVFSMYTIKAKLQSSYIDDSRPTEISRLSCNPDYYCLFSGKINSIYEVESEVDNV
jgi:hypothetical protein